MRVARHEMPGRVQDGDPVPWGRSDSIYQWCYSIWGMEQTWNANHTVPYGTDSDWDLSQAINCLATIIQSLRDKVGIPRSVRPGQDRRAARDISTICHLVICHLSC